MSSEKGPKPPDHCKTGESEIGPAAIGDEIERLLRDAYREVLEEPVPARLLSQLKQIEQKEPDP